MFNYINTSDILERAETIFLDAVNQLKDTTLIQDLPKVMIIQNSTFNTHTKYLNEIINKSTFISAEVFVSNNFGDTDNYLGKVANGDYIVFFDYPYITSISNHTRDDWEYNPDINGVLGDYRLYNIAEDVLTPSKIMAVAKIAAKFRNKANGTLIWGQDAMTGPTTLELLKYNTYRYSKPITIYDSTRRMNPFDLEEKVIIAYESFADVNFCGLYNNPKAIYIDACYRINAESYKDSNKFKEYNGRIVTEIDVRKVDRACILYNILKAYKRVAWSRIGINCEGYRLLDDAIKAMDKVFE